MPLLSRAANFTKASLRGEVRFVRFLAVGVLNTAFGYSVYALMLWSGVSYWLAAGIATVAGVLFNFKSTGSIVFHSNENWRIARFLVVYVIVYGTNVLGLAGLLRVGVDAYMGGLLMLLPLALLAYLLNARYVFPDEKAH